MSSVGEQDKSLWLQKSLTQCGTRLARLEKQYNKTRKQIATRGKAGEDAADLIACSEGDAAQIEAITEEMKQLQAQLRRQVQPAAD